MPLVTKWELTSIVSNNKATKSEETSAVIKNTDTTKDDGLPCDHFFNGVHTTPCEAFKVKVQGDEDSNPTTA